MSAGSTAGRPRPPAEDVRAQLARLLASHAFPASARRRKLLEYVVEQTLAGRGDRLKAYDLAVSVLGRDASFDPQGDPIVRIEVGRLRRDLEHYYLTDGRADPIRITIPKGHYVPAFEVWGQRPAPEATATAGRSGVGLPWRRPTDWRAHVVAGLAALLLVAGVWGWRTWHASDTGATGRAGGDRRAVPVLERRRRRPAARDRTDQRAGQQSDALRRAAGVRICDDQRQRDAPAKGGGRSAGLCGQRRRGTGPGPSAGKRKADRSHVGSSAVEPKLRSGADRGQTPRCPERRSSRNREPPGPGLWRGEPRCRPTAGAGPT